MDPNHENVVDLTNEPLLLATTDDTVMYDGKRYSVVAHRQHAYIQHDDEGRKRRTVTHTIDAQLDDDGYTVAKRNVDPDF